MAILWIQKILIGILQFSFTAVPRLAPLVGAGARESGQGDSSGFTYA